MVPKGGTVNSLIRIMIDHLVEKGMEVSTISGYIRNLAHLIAVNPQITLQELNERMRSLGWDDFRLDGYTLRLILANFETDCPVLCPSINSHYDSGLTPSQPSPP
jgi:hypothetical protein